MKTPITWQMGQRKNKKKQNLIVGVLSLQGDFLEHIQTLNKLNVETKEIRLPQDLAFIDALILPGGESTTIAYLIDIFKLREPLVKEIKSGMPIWGTCAGMILLAKKLKQNRPLPLGVMDIEVNRNAFGRQLDSFEAKLIMPFLGNKPLHATFIRAPLITKVGSEAEIISSLPDGTIVAAKQKNMLATSFHPELTNDLRFHEYFLSLIKK